ncbi:hypothetical protein [Bacillus altitudinis]|uniref:hypothetical protein n=1 Tax=Bacillus altitudinis TaxID=293387 RepID=UPI001F44C97D|nr:hypothetical protein [Bacillus altitudinis]MCM3063969.1 hypothetical protein [Bacillus altitudinis]MCM3077195.1 hypothetical protein [Bacillus altitudinis]
MNWSSFICLYERVRAIVKTCAEYMEYSESEVVDMLLLHILDDYKMDLKIDVIIGGLWLNGPKKII